MNTYTYVYMFIQNEDATTFFQEFMYHDQKTFSNATKANVTTSRHRG